MTRILALGDTHIGAGTGYGTQLYGPGSRLADQAAALDHVREIVERERIDLVLHAGDVFHRPKPTPAELRVWRDFLTDLRCPFGALVISGNHEISGVDQPIASELFYGAHVDRQPAVHHWGDGLLSVATLPWTPAGRLVASRNGGDRDETHREAAAILVETAAGLRAQIPSGEPAILMAHWSVSGAVSATGMDVGLFREPVLDLHALVAQSWDAVVLAHIHRWQSMAPGVFYTGSLTTVDFGEQDLAHGVVILDVDEHGGVSYDHHEVPGRPFVTLDLGEITSDLAMHDITEHVEDLHCRDGRFAGAVVRVRYTATPDQARRVDHAAIKRALFDAGAHQVWKILPELIRSERARAAGVDETLTPLGALDRWIDHQQITDPVASGMRGRTETYLTGAAA